MPAANRETAAASGRSEHEPAGRNTVAAILALSDASKERLVAVFVHELRSHIAPIKNTSELLQRSTLDPAAARQVAIIERQVAGMMRLVTNCSPRRS